MRHIDFGHLKLLGIAIFFLLLACDQRERRDESHYLVEEEHIPTEDIGSSSVENYISSFAAVVPKDSSKKFILSADLRFKSKNLIRTVYTIEDIVQEYNGFVTYSNLTCREHYKKTISINKDSVLVSTVYLPENEMEIRVPSKYLDQTLKKISLLIEHLDYRKIKTTDVTLSLLSDRLEQNRAIKQGKRLEEAIEKKGKKLDETLEAEELLGNKQLNADNALLNKLTLEDKINYATIRISIYQNETIKQEVTANFDQIAVPHFGDRLKGGFQNGVVIFEEIVLILVNLWALILSVGLVVFIVNRYRKIKKRKSSKEE